MQVIFVKTCTIMKDLTFDKIKKPRKCGAFGV